MNTYADVKAESDVCCASGSAAAMVQLLKGGTVIFLPDKHLARNVAQETGKHIIFPTGTGPEKQETELDYQIVGWRGRCEVHEKFTVRAIRNIREQFPDVEILAHPECSPEVTTAADFSGNILLGRRLHTIPMFHSWGGFRFASCAPLSPKPPTCGSHFV